MTRGVVQKSGRFASDAYLRWVAGQECLLCSMPADDAHHLKHVGHYSGGAIKAPDCAAMPLCRACHDNMHGTPALWPMQWELIARTLLRAIEGGVFVLDREKLK